MILRKYLYSYYKTLNKKHLVFFLKYMQKKLFKKSIASLKK